MLHKDAVFLLEAELIMKNNPQKNSRELKIQGMLGGYLRKNSTNTEFKGTESHLDEDSLSAFVEGNLSKREATPMVKHLADCSYCRDISSELVKLDLAFAEDAQPIEIPKSEPTKVADVLNGILSKIFGANDNAVFAHNENEEEEDKEEQKEE